MKNTLITLSAFLFLMSCDTQPKETETNDQTETTKAEPVVLSKSDQLINDAIVAHGGDLYKTAAYSFTFRGKEYSVKNENENFSYSVKSESDNGQVTIDVLTNDSFKRTVDGVDVSLTTEEESKYSNGLNSVIYFALLPYKLNDASVHTQYVEETTIKGEKYDLVAISFAKEGGGQDHDDEYAYWINQKDKKIDYFAYNYRVNGGGARFRSALNRSVVDGITFQDYINWEVSFETPLKDIPALFEKEELKEASRIVTSAITRL